MAQVWKVVEFTDKSTAIVPSSWLEEAGESCNCFWPSSYDCFRLQKAVAHHLPPGAAWDVHSDVRVLVSCGKEKCCIWKHFYKIQLAKFHKCMPFAFSNICKGKGLPEQVLTVLDIRYTVRGWRPHQKKKKVKKTLFSPLQRWMRPHIHAIHQTHPTLSPPFNWCALTSWAAEREWHKTNNPSDLTQYQ